MAAVFRVTQYKINAGDFTGTSYSLALKETLQPNYFAMVEWTSPSASTVESDVGAAVTADPFGTGTLDTAAGNTLKLTRGTAGQDWIGTVKVIECLRANGTSGFYLRDVKETSLPQRPADNIYTTNQTCSAYNSDRTSLHGGYRGGGAYSTAAGASDLQTFCARIATNNSTSFDYMRQTQSGSSAGIAEAAIFTTYVVEWGTEWTIQEVNTGVEQEGGNPPSLTSDWAATSLGTTVVSANTMLFYNAYAEDDGRGTCYYSLGAKLGDGVTIGTTVSEVSGCTSVDSSLAEWHMNIFVCTHASLATDFVSEYAPGTGWTTNTETVDAPLTSEVYETVGNVERTVGERLALMTGVNSGATATGSVGYSMVSCRHAANTSMESFRFGLLSTSQTYMDFQSVDFGGITVTGASEPVFRVTTIKTSMGDGVSSVDITLYEDLSSNYFIMIQCASVNLASPADDSWCCVTQDPFGTGDLASSSGSKVVRLERTGTTGAIDLSVTVVECVRDPTINGFKLHHVYNTPLTNYGLAGMQEAHVDLSASVSWTSLDQVTCLTGYRAAGYKSTGAIGNGKHQSGAVIMLPYGDGRVLIRRYSNAADTLKAGTAPAYILEWGSAWGVQQAISDDNGNGEIPLPTPVLAESSWVMGFGLSRDASPDGNFIGAKFQLGSGSAPSGLQNTMSVEYSTVTQQHSLFIVLTHPDMVNTWITQGASTDLSPTATVPVPIRGESYPASLTSLGYRVPYLTTENNDSTNGDQTQGWFVAVYTGPTTYQMASGTGATGATTWNGSIQSVDLGAIVQNTGNALPADPNNGPQQFLIIPDPYLHTGDGNVVTITDEGGRMAGLMVPANDNYGSMVGLLEGTPENSVNFDIACYNGGGLAQGAGYVMRKAGETPYAGLNSILNFSRPATLGSTSDLIQGQCSICWSRKYNKLIFVRIIADDQIKVRTQGGDASSGWTSATMAGLPDMEFDNTNRDVAATIDIVETQAGSLLVFVERKYNTDYNDVNIFRSDDGGATFQVHQLNMTANLARSTYDLADRIGRTSGGIRRVGLVGPWVRVIRYERDTGGNLPFATNVALELSTYVSGDSGVSWTKVANLDNGGAGLFSINTDLGGAGPEGGSIALDMIGIDEASGLFMLVTVSAGTPNPTMTWRFAYRDEAWPDTGDFGISLGAGADGSWTNVWAVKTSTHVLVFYTQVLTNAAKVPDARTIECFSAPIDRVTESSAWGTQNAFGSAMEMQTAGDRVPYRPKAAWTGNRIIVVGGQAKVASASTSWAYDGMFSLQSGMWDPRPWTWQPEDKYPTHPVLQYMGMGYIEWFAPLGDMQNSVAGVTNTWGTANASASTRTWDYIKVQYGSTDATGYYLDAFTDTAGASTEEEIGLPNTGTSISLECSVTQANSSWAIGGSTDHIGMVIQGGVSGSWPFDMSLRINTTQIVIYDNKTNSVLLTITPDGDLTDWTDIRLWFKTTTAGVVIGSLASRQFTNEPHTPWEEHGTFTLDATATHVNQAIQMGIVAAAGGAGTSLFNIRGLRISKGSGLCQSQNATYFTSPDDMIGTMLSKRPTLLRDGLTARWGGTGINEGDTFTGEIDHTNGREALLVDTPRVYTESVVTTAWNMVVAPDTTDTDPHWIAEALALIGTVDRTATLELGESSSDWTAPIATINLTADLLVGLKVDAVKGAMVKLSKIDGTALPARGTYIGKYLRFLQGTPDGYTYAIKQDNASGWYQLSTDDDLAAEGVNTGTHAVIYDDRMVWRDTSSYRAPFARISFPANGVKGTVAAGKHRLGAYVLGFAKDFDVPLEWSFTNDKQPNETEFRTQGGHTTVFQEGPAQRIITGRIVGDLNEQSNQMRNILDEVLQYRVRPAVLVLDGERMVFDRVIYGRYSSGNKQDNAAWYKDDNDVWRNAGDLSLVFVEEN